MIYLDSNLLAIVDDREEFQHVNVSKKELDDLINDLWNNCGDLNSYDLQPSMNDFDEYANQLNPDGNLPKQATIDVDDLNATLETPNKQTEESQSEVAAASSAGPSNANTYFNPSKMSTPAKASFDSNQISEASYQTTEQPQQQQSLASFDNSLISSANNSSTLGDQQFTYQYPFVTFNDNSSASVPTQSSMNLNKMPSEAITTSAIPGTPIPSSQSNEKSVEIVPMDEQLQGASVEKKPGCRAKRARFKTYKNLEDLDPSAMQPKVGWGRFLLD